MKKILLVIFIIALCIGTWISVSSAHRNPKTSAGATRSTENGTTSGSISASNPSTVATSSNSSSTTEASGISGGPIISFDFDDGWLSAYEDGIPIFNKEGFKTTDFIITGVLGEKNYVTKQDVLALQADGNEIGAHTRTHPHLTQLSNADAVNEIEGSKKDLLDMGIKSVVSFSYPYGDVNQAVENDVKNAGFISARITKPEFDDKTTDPLQLRRVQVNASSTFAQIKGEIDKDISEKKWLILVFHDIDTGRPDSATHQLAQQIVDYVKQTGIPVVTNSQGVRMLGSIN